MGASASDQAQGGEPQYRDSTGRGQKPVSPQPATLEETLQPHPNPMPQTDASNLLSTATQGPLKGQEGLSSFDLKTAPASSETFSSEVRTLLTARSNPGSAPSASSSGPGPSPAALVDCRDLVASRHWPTEEDAYAMLEVVVHHVGISQQMFDAREFSNKLSLVYQESAYVNNIHFSELWMIEMLLVFAIGRMLLAKPDDNGDLPGTGFFEEARRRMPDMVNLSRQGALGVEVVGLAGMYLQIADRKDDAYLYASMALRLAISSGCHRSYSSRFRSANVYRNRLWWSLYMQERRLCAAGGYPMSIGDHAISTPPPYDAAGYPSATHMAVNVRTARVLGQITSLVYAQKEETETAFVTKVSEVLRSLHEIETGMPAELSIKFGPSGLIIAGLPFDECNPMTARTSSSLYISVYSAVIYAVRPILLYMARESPGREMDEQQHGSVSPALRRLAEICVEAASKTLVILQHLRKRELVAKHAFLDLDAAFSVGFIFVLVEAINPTKGLGTDGIEGSLTILSYQALQGNRAASKRLEELNHMCASLSLPVQQHGPARTQTQASPQLTIAPNEVLSQPFSFDSGYNAINPMDYSMTRDISSEVPQPAQARGQVSADQSYDQPGVDWADLASISLDGENDLYWVYHDPTMPFTGVEQIDWGALEGQLPQEPR